MLGRVIVNGLGAIVFATLFAGATCHGGEYPFLRMAARWPEVESIDIRALDVSGDRAALAGGKVYLMDVSDPAELRLLDSVQLAAGSATDVKLIGSVTVVALDQPGLAVLQSGPDGKWLSQSFVGVTPGSASSRRALDVADGRAYVVDGIGLWIFDITDPAAPRLVGQLAIYESLLGVRAHGGYVFVAVGESGPHIPARMLVIDVSNPSEPRIVTDVWDGWSPSSQLVTFAIVSNTLYYPSRMGLQLLDISQLPSVSRISYWEGGLCNGVVVKDQLAYLVGSEGFQVVNVADPQHPALVGTNAAGTTASDVALAGGFALVAAKPTALQVFDLTSAAAPLLAAQWQRGVSTQGISDCNGMLLLANGFAGLDVLDAQQPDAPVIVGNYRDGQRPWDVVAHDGYAFVVDWPYHYTGETDAAHGFEILDVRNPAQPRKVAQAMSGQYVSQIAVDAHGAYVASRRGLDIFDVSDPASPQHRSTTFTNAAANSICVQGTRVYLGGSGLKIVDASDPAHPLLIGHYAPGERLERGLTVRDRWAFVGTFSTGLHIVDVSVPAVPMRIGQYAPGGPVLDVVLAGDLAFVGVAGQQQGADYVGQGIHVLDVSNPAEPVLLEVKPLWPSRLCFRRNWLYAGAGASGLYIY